jgi:hypothetical protein
MCQQETFANVSFMAINMVVLDDEHGISSYILGKKKSPISVSDQACGLNHLCFTKASSLPPVALLNRFCFQHKFGNATA